MADPARPNAGGRRPRGIRRGRCCVGLPRVGPGAKPGALRSLAGLGGPFVGPGEPGPRSLFGGKYHRCDPGDRSSCAVGTGAAFRLAAGGLGRRRRHAVRAGNRQRVGRRAALPGRSRTGNRGNLLFGRLRLAPSDPRARADRLDRLGDRHGTTVRPHLQGDRKLGWSAPRTRDHQLRELSFLARQRPGRATAFARRSIETLSATSRPPLDVWIRIRSVPAEVQYAQVRETNLLGNLPVATHQRVFG